LPGARRNAENSMTGDTTRTCRSVIVTGGGGMIGRATVERLAAAGCDVLAVDLNAATLAELEQTSRTGGKVSTFVADVTNPSQVSAATEQAMALFGGIDGLVNVAGGAGPTEAFEIESIETATWDHVMELNIKSTFLFCRSVIPHMRRAGFGRIVVLSSSAARGQKGPPTTVTARLPYATAKAALIGFTAQLAKDVAADGITVNALAPGLIIGDAGTRIRDRFDRLSNAARAGMLDGIPAGRSGTGQDVAALIEFLLSEGSSFITGATIPIDGGSN
jgi:NAD(P)-dependent dehydrogenase (short-subunit alcohol dehydrogenase family)